jgi:lipoate-protein ligase A
VLWQSRKLAGSAQRRTKNAFLQHGSILIEFDLESLSNALRSFDTTSVISAVADLKTCLGVVPPIRDLIAAISRGFETVFGAHLVNCDLSRDLSARAHDLAALRCPVLNCSNLQLQQ